MLFSIFLLRPGARPGLNWRDSNLFLALKIFNQHFE